MGGTIGFGGDWFNLYCCQCWCWCVRGTTAVVNHGEQGALQGSQTPCLPAIQQLLHQAQAPIDQPLYLIQTPPSGNKHTVHTKHQGQEKPHAKDEQDQGGAIKGCVQINDNSFSSVQIGHRPIGAVTCIERYACKQTVHGWIFSKGSCCGKLGRIDAFALEF